MSFQDDLLVDEEGRAELKEVGDMYAGFVDATDRPFGAQMVLASAVAAEFVLMAVTMFGLGYLQVVINIVYITIACLIAAFSIGFLIPFAAYKLYKNEISPDQDVPIDGGVMSGFTYEENRQRQYVGFYLGAAGAVVNTLVWLGLTMSRL